MILRLSRPKYYPRKKKGKGFTIEKTVQPESSLGFATFKLKKKAVSAGKRWYD